MRIFTMKKFFQAAVVAMAVTSASALAHHAAEDIVDEDVYEMIDSLVADTPHADMTLDDLGAGMTETTLTTPTVTAMENMIDDGLLDYAAMLEGDVEVQISFGDDGSASLSVLQAR
jgi:hypothetical protein